MKIIHTLLLAQLCLLPMAATAERLTEGLDADWRFQQSDLAGGERLTVDDTRWCQLDLPHDWSIAGPFAKTNLTGGAGAFLPGGVAWYRKQFALPASGTNRVVRVEFDGVMQNSDVWINGQFLGHRPFGYVSFSYDLTPHLKWGGKNLLAVRTDTSAQPASRWYSGAGIYRHVRLVLTDPVHIAVNGVFVTTPTVTSAAATVVIETAVTNESTAPREITVQTAVLAPDGHTVATIESSAKVAAGAVENLKQQITIPAPQLWSLEEPQLYQAVSEVRAGGKNLDQQTTPFGIRRFLFAADTGFWLNGKNFKLYGVCLHHDGGAFGAAVPLDIWESRLKALKKLGVNAIRTAHNPVAPEFLDLCDRLGVLVMDEFFDCWTVGKNPHDYHLFFEEWAKRDERETILRDRNHPSVVLYSVGNEIHDTPKPELAKRILAGLVDTAHEADPTRPVTQALFRPNVSGDYTNGLADMLDVIGTNYRDNELLAAQRARPERAIVGTEQRHDRQTWLWLRDNPSHSGQFLWTGVDYLGETKRWPNMNHSSGLLDRTGAIKPMAFERDSWWNDRPVLHIARRTAPDDRMPDDPGYGGEEMHTQVQFADWTPRNPKPHDETVEAYSNCDEVELFLNDKSLGAKKINANATPRVWKVPFAAGTLKAVARDAQGKLVATDELHTAGKAAKIILSTETQKLSPGFDNVAIVRARIVDADGVTVPRADDLISFSITGPGVIACVDNAHPASIEPFQATQRRAYHGECVAYVKASGSSGKIFLKAEASGLKAGNVSIKAAK